MTIPKAVLGGTTLMLFASIMIIGMQMIAKIGFTRKNIMILCLSLGLGYGITLVPSFTSGTYEIDFFNYLMVLLSNPVANMFILSFIMSFAVPERVNND